MLLEEGLPRPLDYPTFLMGLGRDVRWLHCTAAVGPTYYQTARLTARSGRRGLVFATAGSINNGSRLTGMRLLMAAVQQLGRHD